MRDTYHGMYLAGPNSVGKSITIYTLVCPAQAHGWIVLYVPNCDEWAAKASAEEAMKYLLTKIALALVPFYEHPTFLYRQDGRTWEELLMNGLASQNTQQVFSDLLDELCNQEDFPLLLVFDKVNTLFSNILPWLQGQLTKTVLYFTNLTTTLNKLTMCHRWKVLSRTGHEQFLAELPSGLTDTV